MRRASSASLTCNASRSASEYAATVRTPSRRAVRITRLAIRILPNTLAFALSPGRLALLEERRDALLAFRRDADLGDAPGGIRDQRVVQRPPGDGPNELLDFRQRLRPAREEVFQQRIEARIELL